MSSPQPVFALTGNIAEFAFNSSSAKQQNVRSEAGEKTVVGFSAFVIFS